VHKLAYLTSFAFLLAAVAQAAGQSQIPSAPPLQQNATTTLHADSRLVLVDVVVKHHREPVNGLTASDFILLEDGKPQKIAFFNAHEAPRSSASSVNETRHPNVFTNDTAEPPPSITVILFDTLNTPPSDQPYARKQMIEFLKTLPSGYHAALFELGAKLRMLAGFSENSEELVAAANRLVPKTAPLLQTDEDLLQEQEQIAKTRMPYNGESVEAMQQFMSATSASVAQNRVRLTLQGLNTLTAAMSGFHGRKNVIWLSEYFPVFFGLMADSNKLLEVQRYRDLMRGTSSTLSSSQVALYPIDIRGLTSGFFGNAALEGKAVDNVSAIQGIEARHVGMDEIAEDTGGHAYYNTNDLKFAMQRSFESGSEYYTLAYVPPSGADSKYHRIDVRFTRPGLIGEHRKGYFAMPLKAPSDAVSEFAAAVRPAMPVLNRLHLNARLQPPGLKDPNTVVECTISAQDLTFVDQPNNRKAVRLNLLTVAWDKYLNMVAQVSNTVELQFSPEQYARVLHDGIRTTQEMHLTNPGRYDIRTAVMDDANQRIGSLEIPIEISSDAKVAKK
jgi:VWFA-related protein